MKNVLVSLFFMFSIYLVAQEDRFGVTIGATNYITDTDLLFSKSSTGFTFGVFATKEFNERSALFMEINYSRHFVKFVGRENELATPEDIKFNLERVSVPFSYNYSYLILDNFNFGVNVGPSFELYHDYKLTDESKEGYLLDPLLIPAQDLRFDILSDDNTISFNMLILFGLNVQYKENLMASLRYYYGVTNPYRRSPFYSTLVETSGKESYFTFTLTYFFN
ncbi:MAG: outer membrane beta-barrel protein [Algibacter sp.]